jgi:predicted cupin superfamily sugar epimerase
MHPDARALIEVLQLAPHPEGGFFREVFRSASLVEGRSGRRSASTAIYFLLPAGTFSALHRVRSDEVWHHYDGDPVELHTIDERGVHAMSLLGRDLAGDQRPQRVVPAEVWQAALPRGSRFSLCGCTVAPGFEFVDFEMPGRSELVRAFPHLTATIERLTLGVR